MDRVTHNLGEYERRALAAAEPAASTCFMCRWIQEDIRKNGKMTGYPLDFTGAGTFPVEGKVNHLVLEKNSRENA